LGALRAFPLRGFLDGPSRSGSSSRFVHRMEGGLRVQLRSLRLHHVHPLAATLLAKQDDRQDGGEDHHCRCEDEGEDEAVDESSVAVLAELQPGVRSYDGDSREESVAECSA
jgi:hypothetical protein